MKTKILKTFLFCLLISLATPAISFSNPAADAVETKEAQAHRLTQRLEEIQKMDTQNMTRREKRVLRTEVRTIKKELAVISGGVYLSVGAILLIALLLILLL